MRRKERALSQNEIIQFLEENSIMRIALVDNQIPYIIPLNYGFLQQNNALFLYFHSAKQGRKIEILSANPFLCFEIDKDLGLKTGENPWDYSQYYISVIGTGKAEFIQNHSEKIIALTAIMKNTPYNKEVTCPMLNITEIVKIHVQSVTGKRHIPEIK